MTILTNSPLVPTWASCEGYNAALSPFSDECMYLDHDVPFGFVQPRPVDAGFWSDSDGVVD